MAFGSHLMASAGVYVAPVWNGEVEPVTLMDEWGEVDFFLLPFLKPAHVRRYYEEEVGSYTDAMRLALSGLKRTEGRRSVLVTHQFVTGATRSESEEISVGGSDNVDASVFESFDYVALGHIHGPQNCGSERIRYSGTPLKYSLSEAKDEKSVTVVELSEGGAISLRTLPLSPLRNMVELRGSYGELVRRDFYEDTSYREDYVHITLTDEEDVMDAVGKLRVIYRNLMKLDYDNRRTRGAARAVEAAVETKSPLELFADLYEMQNNGPMSEVQRDFVKGLIEEIWEEKA
jgi:exonuclease SbcD